MRSVLALGSASVSLFSLGPYPHSGSDPTCPELPEQEALECPQAHLLPLTQTPCPGTHWTAKQKGVGHAAQSKAGTVRPPGQERTTVQALAQSQAGQLCIQDPVPELPVNQGSHRLSGRDAKRPELWQQRLGGQDTNQAPGSHSLGRLAVPAMATIRHSRSCCSRHRRSVLRKTAGHQRPCEGAALSSSQVAEW